MRTDEEVIVRGAIAVILFLATAFLIWLGGRNLMKKADVWQPNRYWWVGDIGLVIVGLAAGTIGCWIVQTL